MEEVKKVVFESNYDGLNVEEVIYANLENCYGKMQDYPLDIITDASVKEVTPRPVVIFIHGGAFKLPGNKRAGSISLVGRKFIDKGYVIVAPNYPVYDTAEDRDADNRAAVPIKPPAAIKATYEFILNNAEKYGFDTKRIAIVGSSAGAATAFATISKYKELKFACLGSLWGAPAVVPDDISHFPPLFAVHGTMDMSYVREAPVTAAFAEAHISRTLISLGGSRHSPLDKLEEFAPQLAEFIQFHFDAIK